MKKCSSEGSISGPLIPKRLRLSEEMQKGRKNNVSEGIRNRDSKARVKINKKRK